MEVMPKYIRSGRQAREMVGHLGNKGVTGVLKAENEISEKLNELFASVLT